MFPRQHEILAYVRGIADGYGVAPHIRFGCEMHRSEWDERNGRWLVRTSDCEVTCDVLVSAIGVLPAATSATATSQPEHQTGALRAAKSQGSIFHRTELYFGRNKPGGEVSEEQFAHFLAVEVTKRFPDGLTLIDGLGQFLDSSGTIVKEKSKLLILFYPLSDRQADGRVEDVRTAYKGQFQQESVLRTDTLQRVSF